MIGAKIFQMAISLIVNMFTARYLGPSNFGLISYAASFTAFFSSFCTLGINGILVKEIIENKEKNGEIIGTSIVMRFVSSLLSVIVILILVSLLNDGDPLLLIIVLLCSVGIMFNVMETIVYWYQSKLQSKVPSIISLIAYSIMTVYRILLLVFNKDVKWFAFATSLDTMIIAIFLYFSYKKHGGQKLTFSLTRAKYLFSQSYHYILSGLMISIYGQSDKIMLKAMMGTIDVGYYSAALNICSLWTFVLYALIDSARPIIIQTKSVNNDLYEKRITQLYAAVIWISVIVSIIFTVFAGLIIKILYGYDFLPAISPFRILTWFTAFSFLGVAREIWIVCENNQKYLKYIFFFGAIMNIILNYFMINKFGLNGAAISTFITQLSTAIIIPMFFKRLRKNNKYIINALLLKNVFKRY
jgi:O-antigen/teichoic acid export membrane protein